MKRMLGILAMLLTFSASGAAEPAKKKLVMIAGTPSHGPGMHEFNAGTQLLAKCLQDVKGLDVSVHLNGWPKDDKVFDGADAIFIYCDGGVNHPAVQMGRLDRIAGLMKKGTGLMCAHYGVEVVADKGGKEFQQWIGGYYEHMFSVNPIWKPEFKEFPKHPIANGVKPFTAEDEWYFNMRFAADAKITPILAAKPSDATRDGPYVYPRGPYKHIQEAKGRSEAMMWAIERPDGGRGVGFTGGHFHTNWKNDDFRKSVLNALLWISKLDVPADGVRSVVTDEDIKANLDPKGKKK